MRVKYVHIDNPKRTFVASDYHFDHFNIIRYQNRPFNSVEQMNSTILARYAYTIRGGDEVFYLGDLAYGRNSRSAGFWLSKLSGSKHFTFIKGSHDPYIRGAYDMAVLSIGGKELLLIHDPADVPRGYTGWVIHGHVHGNAPLIDSTRKRINVSAEVVDYEPVSLASLMVKARIVEPYAFDLAPVKWVRSHLRVPKQRQATVAQVVVARR
jgi:calcineurin-like phosphoesterase family protein